MSVATRLGMPAGEVRSGDRSSAAPGLLYAKWHAYDDAATLATKASRVPFLEAVAAAVDRLVAGDEREVYAGWHQRYLAALLAAGAEKDTLLRATTLWRLVAGFATNPALESGLHLYPLYGFPYLPGSSVRGLVHHRAEMALLETADRVAWPGRAEPPDGDGLDRFLVEATQVRALFGSLTVEPIAAAAWRQAAGDAPRLETPRSLLERWLAHPALAEEPRLPQARRARALLNGQSGGLLSFYDAIPAPGTAGLLQVDILNPHYPLYYRSSPPTSPPADDQSPNPVYFLAVRPGAAFLFPFRLAPWPVRPADDAGQERLAALANLSREEAKGRVLTWLGDGLTDWGAGAKTAAGYGYFHVGGASGPDGAKPQSLPAPPPQPPPDWPRRVQTIRWENAAAEISPLLAALAGRDRTRAALELVKTLGAKKLRATDQPWARDVLDAAGLL